MLVVHSSRPLNRPCMASSCTSSAAAAAGAARQADQQKSVCVSPELCFPGERASGRGTETKTPPTGGKTQTAQRGLCRAVGRGGKKPTLVHKAAILNSLTVLVLRRTREAQNVTPCTLCAPRRTARRCGRLKRAKRRCSVPT